MNKLSYKNVVSKGKEKSNGKLTRLVLAFMGGAIIAFIGQGLYDLYFFVFNIINYYGLWGVIWRI